MWVERNDVFFKQKFPPRVSSIFHESCNPKERKTRQKDAFRKLNDSWMKHLWLFLLHKSFKRGQCDAARHRQCCNLANYSQGRELYCSLIWVESRDGRWETTKLLGRANASPAGLLYLSAFPLTRIVTWLILPVVICLSQRLSHACLSINKSIQWNCEWLIKSVIVYLMVPYYLDNRGNSRANTCAKSQLEQSGRDVFIR